MAANQPNRTTVAFAKPSWRLLCLILSIVLLLVFIVLVIAGGTNATLMQVLPWVGVLFFVAAHF
jgi:hypothetical protein